MQNWNQWQVPTGPVPAAMPQPPVGYPTTGTDPMATMQAYMQYYNQPAPSGYTPEQWAAAQQQNWAQWTQWQQQYQQWQTQYGDKYQETMKQYTSASLGQPPPLPASQPPLPKDESSKPPLPPDPSGSYNYTGMPPPHQNNLPLFPSKQTGGGQNAPQNPPLPPSNPPLPSETKPSSIVSDKSSADSESAKKLRLDEEKMIEIEKTFDAQFKQWEDQVNTWKQKNQNHPAKEQYKQYEAKWTSWREKLLERREQMRRKREQQKQAARVEAEKNKDLPGGDKILNLLSNTENQGLINNLLGIGKTLGLTGKQEAAVSSAAVPAKPVSNTVPVTTQVPIPQPANVTAMQGPTMTPELSQQSWVAQQWAQYNSGMTPNYSNYQMPPPMQQQPPAMAMQPPNYGQQPPNFSQQPQNYSQQAPNFMQPPPNFSQPPPNFVHDNNMFNKPPPQFGPSINQEVNQEMEEMGGPSVNRNTGPDDRNNDDEGFDDEMNDMNTRNNRFGPGNKLNSGNDSFSPSNRFDSNFSSNRFGNDRFNKGNNRFDNTDCIGSGNNRFRSNNDRFGSNDRYGNKGPNESSFNNDMPPEIRKLMEKRKAAMDAFKPRGSSFLDPEKTLNVGSLRESFKKITGDTLFKSRSVGSSEDSGPMGNRSSFGLGPSPFKPRSHNEFEPRGPSFKSQGPGDFDSGPRNFGPRGGPGNFGMRGPGMFGPRGPGGFGQFGRSENSPMQSMDQGFKDNKEVPSETVTNVETTQGNIEQAPMESPKMPEILEGDKNEEQDTVTIIPQDDVMIIPPVEQKNDDIVEIPVEKVDTNPPDNSWMNVKDPESADKQGELNMKMDPNFTNKNQNLPFMGEDDPKPTDLNMEPPPDFPNFGSVITTPMDPPPAFMEDNFLPNEETSKDRQFNEPFNRGPPPFNNFGPRGMNQPFNSNDQSFGPRGMNPPFRPFGPRGMDGGQSFGPRGMFNQSFGPRGSNNQSFGPRGGVDGSLFGPRGGPNGPPFRFGMDNSPFGNRPPFGMRDTQPDFNQSNEPKKIPSLFDLKFDSNFKKPDFGSNAAENFGDDNFDSNVDNQSEGSFSSGNFGNKSDQFGPRRDWNQPPPGNKFDQPPPGCKFDQLPPGKFDQPLSSNKFNQPPSGGKFDQPPLGGNFDQPPPGGKFDQPPPGCNFDQPVPGGKFDQPPPGKKFDQPPPGKMFDQPPPESDFSSDNVRNEEGNQPPPPEDIRMNLPDNRMRGSEPPQRENGSNYDPFEIFKNRERERDMRKPPMLEFCVKKQFNYNHGQGPSRETRSALDHIPVKVIDYEHNSRRVQELMTTVESYDYGHGQLKPSVPKQAYPKGTDFRNWEESEQNLRDYCESMKTREFESNQRDRFRSRDRKKDDPPWREDAYKGNRLKRHADMWDADVEFKKMKHEKESTVYGGHQEDRKRNKEKKNQDINFADDDFLEEISWDGDNDQCLKDVSEDTKNESRLPS